MRNDSTSENELWNHAFACALTGGCPEVDLEIGSDIGRLFHSRASKLEPPAAASRFLRVVAQARVSLADAHDLLQKAWNAEDGAMVDDDAED